MKLKKACRFPGCPELTHERFCAVHRSMAWQNDQRRTSRQRGYDRTWEKLAQLRRQLDAYLCQPCLTEGELTISNIVDHIVPLHVRPDWRLVLENTQVICPLCHARKTADDTRRYGSSTQKQLSSEQLANIERARTMEVAPRCTSDEVSEL